MSNKRQKTSPLRPPSELVSEIPLLLSNHKYSDLTLECNGRQWHVHKFVVCTQSAFSAKACEGNTWEEAKQGKVHLPDDDGDVVESVVQYLYTSDYEHIDGALTHDVKVYTLADKLDIPLLVEKASTRFCARAKNLWDTEGFAAAIREIYENAPERDRSMRRAVVEISANHAKQLLEQESGVEFRKVVGEIVTFGIEFQLAAMSVRKWQLDEQLWYYCNQTRKAFAVSQDPMDGYRCPFCNYNNDDFSPCHSKISGIRYSDYE